MVNPDDVPAWALSRIEDAANSPTPESALNLIDDLEVSQASQPLIRMIKAEVLHGLGRLLEAKFEVKEVLRGDPGNWRAWLVYPLSPLKRGCQMRRNSA